MSLSTPRQRPPASSTSTPGSTSSRTRASAPHLAFSPLSHTSSTRSVSAQSVPSYQPSVASSSFPNTQATRYLSTASIAPSNLGSIATTANPGSARFRRGHVRTKANAQTPGGVSSMNPDLVDLMALEDPDSVFRMFGVRDVRKIEQRASDAANAKVAELRTMVGERYRDLLAAADSIVRMRGAADKLLDRLEGVETAILTAGDAMKAIDSIKPRRPSLVAHQSDSANLRTLANPPTLSLTLHLFLNLSSLVHSLIDESKFLPAARLENIGRVVWRELEEYKPEEDRELEEGGEERSFKSVRESFPIVIKHHESMAQLGPLIVRRATAELRSPSLVPTTVAQILASLILLDHASTSSSLNMFLKARSQALSSLLAQPRASTSKALPAIGAQSVKVKVEKVLDCILKTVEAVDAIFSNDNPLLLQYLKEIEHPGLTSSPSPSESSEPKLQPILTTLPNYSTLARHLPNSILSYNPFLSSTSSPLSKETISESLSTWVESSTALLLAGVNEWITSLISTDHPALSLSQLRDSINAQLASASPPCSLEAQTLQKKLIQVIESRLNQVYTFKLSQLVQNLEPSLRSHLSQLSSHQEHALQERDSAKFLFSVETPQHFGSISSRSTSSSSVTVDPFASYLSKVGKRVDGRTPLVDEGLEVLEKSASQIRVDLKSWLSEETKLEGERERSLREKYIQEASVTLEGIVAVLDKILAEEETNEEQGKQNSRQGDRILLNLVYHYLGISNTLFIGSFARQLSLSRTFVPDLLLGVPPASLTMLQNWQSRLADIQARSLHLWQEDAVRRAVLALRRGSDKSLLVRNSSTLPNEPSTFLLQSLNSLLHSLHDLPLHRLYSTPSPAAALLKSFSDGALQVAGEFLELLRNIEGGEETKRRLVWDVTLIGLIVGKEEQKTWEQLTKKLAQLLPPSTSPTQEEIAQSATTYLLRTQSIYSPFFPSPSPLPLAPSIDLGLSRSPIRLLPLGPPPPATQGEFKNLLRVVQPGSRLGLLPTKG
ncbi:hypothetical protein JCM3765_004484 [Sporobolomyces pararoseus]